jgi:hypothetical protein
MLPYTKASYCIEGGRSTVVSKAGRRNWGGGVEEGFFGFFPCSQCVPIRFPNGSSSPQVVPQDIPSSTSDFSHMVCPKLNSDVYKLKRCSIGECICFLLCNVESKEVLLLGHAQHSKTNWWCTNQLMYGSFEKKKKLWEHP